MTTPVTHQEPRLLTTVGIADVRAILASAVFQVRQAAEDTREMLRTGLEDLDYDDFAHAAYMGGQ